MNFKDIFITKQVDFLNKSLLEKLTEFITSLIKHGNLGLAQALRFVLSTIENFARGRNSILSGSSSFLSTKSDVCNCQHLFHCPNWFHFHRSGNLSLNPQCHSLLNFKSVEVVSHNPLIKTKSQNVQLVRSWLARWPSRWHCSTRSFSNGSTDRLGRAAHLGSGAGPTRFYHQHHDHHRQTSQQRHSLLCI